MSYSLDVKHVEKEMKVFLTKTNNTGNLSDDDIVDLNTTSIYNNVLGLTLNSNNVVLSGGYYMIECVLGISNSNNISNYANWNILVDDVEQDIKGSSTQDNKVGIDSSVSTISVPRGTTKTIKVKITDVGGTCSIHNDYSYVMIKHVLL